MKRGISILLATAALALSMGASTASAGLLPLPGGQTNASDQDQIQILPIAPQVNGQNVNVLTLDDVEQGNANNANTGQANQQENTATGSSGADGKEGDDCKCPDTRKESEVTGPTSGQTQANFSDQEQVQIVPVAPQLNAQNVNVLTFDDVEQGNANNANTGQASQQENTLVTQSSHGGTKSSGGPSQTGRQGNFSDQEQIQIVPIAPQVNLQNVNVATFGDVEQGDANNANTGQANQQENTLVSRGSRGKSSGGQSQTGRQGNFSDQDQIQILPIAPQVNAQNVNVLTFGDVEQGNANNANTGQANQQENTLVAQGSRGGHGQPARGGSCKCKHPKQGAPSSHRSGGNSSGPSQVNASDQDQIQILPIAPQVNAQNVNVLTFGDVEQGNANNANTGQANQQENTLVAQGSRGGHGQPARGGSCKCKHPKQGAPSSHRSGGNSSGPSQVNASDQDQIQILPIAPQVNAQNVNVLTFGDVEQGNANNANTGQANQQENTLVARGSDQRRGPRLD